MKRLMVLLIVVAALGLTAGGVSYGQSGAGHPPRMFLRHPGPAALFGYGQYLYVTVGGKILEYKLNGMTLAHSVDLPACAPPPPRRAMRAEGHFPQMPPPPPPPIALWAGHGKLYLLEGPAIHVFKVPGLTMEKTVRLPRPNPPPARQ